MITDAEKDWKSVFKSGSEKLGFSLQTISRE